MIYIGPRQCGWPSLMMMCLANNLKLAGIKVAQKLSTNKHDRDEANRSDETNAVLGVHVFPPHSLFHNLATVSKGNIKTDIYQVHLFGNNGQHFHTFHV